MNLLKVFLIFVSTVMLVTCRPQSQGPSPTPSPGQYEGSTSADPAQNAEKDGRPMVLHTNDLNWLVQNSPLIFVGRLSSQEASKDQRGLIITRNTFEAEKIIVGDTSEKTITLTTLGGTVGNETMNVSHMPVFAEGQRYIIFTDLKRTTYNPITENQAGVMLVGPDSGIYTYNGVAVSGVENGILQLSDLTLEVKAAKGTQTQKTSPQQQDPKTEGGVNSVTRTKPDTRKPVSLDQFIELIQRTAYKK